MTLLEWCKENANRGKIILSEWTGVTSTGGRFNSPSEVTSQSNKELVWRCEKGHEWVARVQKRTLLGSDCPYCSNQKIAPGQNDLHTWCLNNNKNYLIDEWIGVDEFGGLVDIHNIAKSSHKKVYWKHEVNGVEHKWLAKISDRTVRNSRCPICYGKNTLKTGVNDLETWCNENPDFGDILKRQWLGKTELGEDIDMCDISKGSHTKVAWECECGNIWYTDIVHRLYRKAKMCPKCNRLNGNTKRMKQVIGNSTSLLDWCNQDNVIGKRLIEEWTGIDKCGESINMSDVTYGSQQEFYWEHTDKFGETHTWIASIHNRVFNHSMCPHCNNKGTSLPEQIIYRCFKQIYPNTISRGKFQGYEFDITIPELRTCIEYGSIYFHDGREERDKEKEELCNKYRVNLIKIIDDSENILEHIDSKNLIIDRFGDLNLLKEKIQFLFKEYELDFSKVNYDKAVVESIDFMSN